MSTSSQGVVIVRRPQVHRAGARAEPDARVVALIEAARPREADAHLFQSVVGWHALLADGSRVFDIDDAVVRSAHQVGLSRALAEAGAVPLGFVGDSPPTTPPLRTLSLAVAQACNMGCGYCYAGGGAFGGQAKLMSWEVAHAAVERLLADAAPGEQVRLAYMGGEPLLARGLIQRLTDHASRRAQDRGVRIGFSITTNGTLLSGHDLDLFERHGFAVTVSLDGVGEAHDRQRPFKNGAPSYERIVERVAPLLKAQRAMQVSARVTVTPHNLALKTTLDTLVDMGFHSVGFSPLLKAHNRVGEMAEASVGLLLQAMVECGDEYVRHAKAGRRYPFANLASVLLEIHRGTHRPYPCGAGAGYFGVSAEGGLFACHRFVEDAGAELGNVRTGVDTARQAAWLTQRHVHRQSPCTSCWARYLCGGGCHHEVIARGRPACDYIRGWLHYGLQTYVDLIEARPDFFAALVSGAGPALPT